MKRTILAIALCAAAGWAWAQPNNDDEERLPPVVVEHIDGARVVADCTPPNDAPACAAFHELIRENFSPHEIALLFGPATGYADFRTSYSFAREHYAEFIRDIEENGLLLPVAYEQE